MKNNSYQRSLELYLQLRGKIGVNVKMAIEDADSLSLAYTPSVAEPCRVIAEDDSQARHITLKGNSVEIVSDGPAVLGLGNIGPLAALPVMEGKALLFKEFAGIDAWPICLDTQDSNEIIETVRRIAPTFGGINLEDISAPRCFEIESALQYLGIPVFHDDQHGTAIVQRHMRWQTLLRTLSYTTLFLNLLIDLLLPRSQLPCRKLGNNRIRSMSTGFEGRFLLASQ